MSPCPPGGQTLAVRRATLIRQANDRGLRVGPASQRLDAHSITYALGVTPPKITLYSRSIVTKDFHQLLDAARKYRNMSADGDDPHLKAALILLADEFEREAEGLEADQNGVPDKLSSRFAN